MTAAFIHESAEVHPEASVGEGTSIWNNVQIRHGAVIGRRCILGKNVYIDHGVRIGDQVKIQNNSSVFMGVEIADDVFIGPHVCFTNDLYPRAVSLERQVKMKDDWEALRTFVDRGASVGAHSVIVAGLTIGEWAVVGAGSVVTRNVPPYALFLGHPARLVGFVCVCGKPLRSDVSRCARCDSAIPDAVLDQYRRLFAMPGRIVVKTED
jgi:UDP-2-acetamido-3-amino-2,3-dideoxy-glucuronate N-acetyltransferase